MHQIRELLVPTRPYRELWVQGFLNGNSDNEYRGHTTACMLLGYKSGLGQIIILHTV